MDNDRPVICKINDDKEMNELEGDLVQKLNSKGYTNFPKLHGIGVKYKRSYQILERFGRTLEFY